MGGGKPEQSILFADICRSTQLFEQYGDERARRIIAATLDKLSAIAIEHAGRVIKTIGDEIMCTLPEAHAGLEAARAMQKVMFVDNSIAPDKLAVRIGVHHGPVLEEDGDVFGDAVNIAQRMSAAAVRDQVVTTTSTVRAAAAIGHIPYRALGETRVKGKQAPLEIAEVQWREDAHVTAYQTSISEVLRIDDGHTRPHLSVCVGELSLKVLDTSAPLTIGRDQHNTVVLQREWVSRNHAHIEYRKGFFVLTDRSTNGTYIRDGQGEAFRVHRDEAHLREYGIVSLGKAFDKVDDTDLLSYEILKSKNDK